MARSIYSNYYYEDNYVKTECQDCKKSFIVGEKLSNGIKVSCPYCRSANVESVSKADERLTKNMNMGCLRLSFHLYEDGELMLYTENEFAEVMKKELNKLSGGMPLCETHAIMERHCMKRDGLKEGR